MNCYVISLAEAKDRRQHINYVFNQAGLKFEFFDAIKPDSAKEILLNISNTCDLDRLSPGEIACLASHVMLWQQLLDSPREYDLIFEDDVLLGDGIQKFLNELTQNLDDLDLVKLETFQEKVLLGNLKKKYQNRNLFELKSFHSGTAGYLLTRAGAKKLIQYLNTKNQILAADHYIFEEVGREFDFKVDQVVPAVCIQEKVFEENSQLSNWLEQDRSSFTRIKRKKFLFIRIIREFQRFILKQKLKFFSKIVEFK